MSLDVTDMWMIFVGGYEPSRMFSDLTIRCHLQALEAAELVGLAIACDSLQGPAPEGDDYPERWFTEGISPSGIAWAMVSEQKTPIEIFEFLKAAIISDWRRNVQIWHGDA